MINWKCENFISLFLAIKNEKWSVCRVFYDTRHGIVIVLPLYYSEKSLKNSCATRNNQTLNSLRHTQFPFNSISIQFVFIFKLIQMDPVINYSTALHNTLSYILILLERPSLLYSYYGH